ncbi:unnamed protein product, partial [Ixodes pacificus]
CDWQKHCCACNATFHKKQKHNFVYVEQIYAGVTGRSKSLKQDNPIHRKLKFVAALVNCEACGGLWLVTLEALARRYCVFRARGSRVPRLHKGARVNGRKQIVE